MERLIRSIVAVAGAVAALGWAVVFVRAPGAALELLLFASPVVAAVWLIVALTARQPEIARGRRAPAAPAPPLQLPAVGGPCAACGCQRATVLTVRRPPRPGEPEGDGRYLPLCDACAATSVLPRLPAR